MPAEHTVPVLIGLVVGAAGLFLQWCSLRARARAGLLRDLPTVPAAAVSVGLFEVQGRASATPVLLSAVSATECVLHRWSVAEEYRRVHTEVRAVAGGRTQTSTRVEQGWQRIAGAAELHAFDVVDESGGVRVDPVGARLELQTFHSEVVGAGDPRYHAHASAAQVSGSTGRRRLLDEGITVDAPLFVVGRARWRTGDVAAEFAEDPEAPLYEISVRGERAVQRRQRFGGATALVLGLLITLAAGWLLVRAASGADGQLDPRWGFLIAAVVSAILQLAGWVLVTYNSVVDLSKRVDRAGSTIDIELQRRADLLPRLVACLDVERDHERGVQTALASLRAAARATAEGLPGEDARSVSEPLAVVLKAYPGLDSDASFQQLSRALIIAEDRIARSRATYNDFATSFNTRLDRIPDGWIAGRVRRERVALLAADAFRVRPELCWS